MPASFEWDRAKAAVNEAAHGVTFEDASSAFDDPFALAVEDVLHSEHEQRYLLVGVTSDLRLLTVVYTMRRGVTRIIFGKTRNSTRAHPIRATIRLRKRRDHGRNHDSSKTTSRAGSGPTGRGGLV